MKISIALCTYNGERFIEEQLKSIISQSLLPDEIVICDDRSKDRSTEIINKYVLKYSGIIKLYVNEKKLGVTRNFERAISLCTGDYIMLSDQDDFWKENKIELTFKKMQEIEVDKEVPTLVHTDLEIVDDRLHRIHESFVKKYNIKMDKVRKISNLLVRNYAVGCTMMMNKSLKNIALPFYEGVIIHDWWLVLIATLFGEIGFVSEATIEYRQHKNNVIGAGNIFVYRLMRKENWIKLNAKYNSIVRQMFFLKQILDHHNKRCYVIDEFIRVLKEPVIKRYFLFFSLKISEDYVVKKIFIYLFLWKNINIRMRKMGMCE